MKAELKEMSFKSDLIGLTTSIETIAIVTASNPKGIALSKLENNKRNAELESLLKAGKYVYRKVIGQYNTIEHSYVISNIALSEIKNIAAKYEQESFIFGIVDNKLKKDKSNRKCIMEFGYWQADVNKKIDADSYTKLDDVDRVVYTDKAVDFFTRHKNFKFNLPFSIFESIDNEYKSFNISSDVMEAIKNDLHKDMSGKHLWMNRAKNYKQSKKVL